MHVPSSLLPRVTTLVALAVSLLVSTGCDSSDPTPPPPTPTTGTITGTVSLVAGVNGSVQNTRVAIYQDLTAALSDSPIRTVGADANGNYSFANLVPGTYYLDAVKDNNNNNVLDTGDFGGVYGTFTATTFNFSPLQVAAGQTATGNMELFLIP